MTMTLTAMPALATPADTRPALVARPVCTEADALLMGEIRHTQRAGFSQDNGPIDHAHQREWWAGWRNRINAWLYYDGAALVGYGCLIQRNDGTWVSSCAVLPAHEGRRFGRTILHHLITSVPHEVYAQARTDNPAACALHNPLEWEVTGQTHHLVFYRTRPKVRTEYPVTLGGYE